LRTFLVVPALDEEDNIAAVVAGFLGTARLDAVIVADNGSRDATAARATDAGAHVVAAPARGYGTACLAGIAEARRRGPPDVLVFADGDGASDPADLAQVLAPIARGDADLVIGSRVRRSSRGALTGTQRFGNALAVALLRALYGARATDLGPFRAIRWEALERLGMVDPNYGWTIEMQVKASRHRLRVTEVDVANHPRRAGVSKVSGSLRGAVGAGYKIITTLIRYR
jgi:glycosyltransferase involved in cell wall biosynthesis